MKKCELASCDVEFEVNSNRQKFCSLKCKRKAAKDAAEPNDEFKQLPTRLIPDHKPVMDCTLQYTQKNVRHTLQVSTLIPWVKEIKDFCIAHGIVPADLIASYKAAQKPTSKSKQVQKKSSDTAPPYERDEPVSAVPKNRQRALTEPVPGTNAYFLRYGKWNPND